MVVHFEVYVLEGRGWMLHARHPRSGREMAMAEAKELEQSLRIQVKVVREAYHPEDNSFDESEIYVTGGKASPAGFRNAEVMVGGKSLPHAAAAKPTAGRVVKTVKAAAAAPRRAKAVPRQVSWQLPPLMLPLLAILGTGLAGAFLAVSILPDIIDTLWKLGWINELTPDSFSRMLMLVFVGTFLLISVPLGMRFLVPQNVQEPPAFLTGRHRRVVAQGERQQAVRDSLEKLVEEEERRMTRDALGLSPSSSKEEPEKASAAPAEPPPPAMRERESKSAEPPKDPRPKDLPPPPEPESGKANIQSMRPAISDFLAASVAKARQSLPSLDSYNKFALHLYMAGAVETLCSSKKMGERAKSELVAFALEGLGTRGAVAERFYEKLGDYLVEPRYLGMVQAGRDAMNDTLRGSKDGAHAVLKERLKDWNKKQDQQVQIMTVMFTDMVGSTDMTQARGDSAAQEIVRKHNSIVRGALSQFTGREIKHTGDGIMASFASAAAAAEACIAIQRQVRQHNGRQPDQELHLRIGLNAGEPIQEEDDLFGATIQLAARVCAATETDQILCTQVVKDLAANKGSYAFRAIGAKPMKGFKDAIPLYEIGW